MEEISIPSVDDDKVEVEFGVDEHGVNIVISEDGPTYQTRRKTPVLQTWGDVTQELIALTYARRDWKGYPHYQEAIQPLEEQLEQKITALGLLLDVRWDSDSKRYGLFPRDVLFHGNSKD